MKKNSQTFSNDQNAHDKSLTLLTVHNGTCIVTSSTQRGLKYILEYCTDPDLELKY